jgi:hypothetical protein
MQKILVIETRDRLIGSPGLSYLNINFPHEDNSVFPANPREALKRGWHLLAVPALEKNEDSAYEWWFEQPLVEVNVLDGM